MMVATSKERRVTALDQDSGARVRLARHQRIRLQRQGLAFANYAVFMAISFYFLFKGELSISLPTLLIIDGLVFAANAFFIGLIISGLNLRFRDPSLTGPQIVTGALILLAVFWASRTYFVQDIYLFALLMSILFSTFQQNMKAVAVQIGIIFLIYAVVIIWRGRLTDEMLIGTGGRVGIYAVLLFWVIVFATYVSRLSHRLSARNHDLHAAMARIEEMAIKDELTGAYNRRFIHESLSKEMERSQHMDMPFSVCLLDVDHFKHINDSHGHLAGDAVLRGLVERIRSCIRRLDRMGHRDSLNLVARFGGEEFLLLLPGTTMEGARVCAERVCGAIGESPFVTDAGELHVTISCGVAEYRVGETVEALVGRVDGALYKAKENGRDRVEVAL